MSDKIKKSDISSNDPFSDVTNSARMALIATESLLANLALVKAAADSIKIPTIPNSGGGNNAPKVKTIEEMNKAFAEGNDLIKLKIQIERDLIREREQLKGVNREILKSVREEIVLEKSSAKTIAELRLQIQRTNKEAKIQAELTNKNTGAYRKASIRLNKMRTDLKNIIIEEGKASKGTKRLAREVILLDGKLRAADAAAGQFGRNVGNYPDVVGRATSVLRQFGLTVGGIGLGKKVFDEINTFEQGLISVGKVANISGDELKEFGARTIEASNDLKSISTEKLLELSAAAAQLGVEGEGNILKFAETLARLEKASDVVGEEGAKSIARILNITKEGTGTVDQFASSIVALGNNFAASESEIIKSTTEVARATAAFDVSSQEAAAFGATLVSLGVQAESGGTAIGKTFRSIEKSILAGGDQFKELERITGLTGDALRKTFAEDSTKVFNLFIKGLAKTAREGENLTNNLEKFGLSSDRILKVLPVLVGRQDELSRALELSSDEYERNTANVEESDAAMDSIQGGLDSVTNSFSNLFTEMAQGQGVFGSIKDILFFIGANLRTILKFMGVAVAAWVSYRIALRAVNKETGEFRKFKLISFFKNLVTGLRGLVIGTKSAALGFKAMGAAIKSIPFAAIVSGIATVISSLFLFGEEEEDAANKTSGLTDELERQQRAIDRLKSAIDFALSGEDFGKQLFEFSKQEVENFADVLASEVEAGLDKVTSAADAFGVKVGEITAENVVALGDELQKVFLTLSETTAGKGALSIAILETDQLAESLPKLAKIMAELNKRQEALNKSTRSGNESKEKEKTELQKLLIILKKVNDERANELIIHKEVRTELFEEQTLRAKALTERIKNIRKILGFNKDLQKDHREEISLLNAQIEAEIKRSTGIDSGRIQVLQIEINKYKEELDILDKLAEKDNATEETLIAQTKVRLSLIDAEKELNNLSFGRLDPLNTERDLVRDTAKIKIKFIEEERAALLESREIGEFKEKDQKRLNELILEQKKLEQDIRNANFEQGQEDIVKAKLDLENKFNEDRLLGVFKTDEEILAAEKKLNEELLKLEIARLKNQRGNLDERSQKHKEITAEILAAEQELFDSVNEKSEESTEDFKTRMDERNQIVQLATDFFIDQIDRRIDKIEEEKSAAQDQADLFSKLAESGNITAKESLAEQNKIIREAERERIALEKRKQQILLVSSTIQAFNSNLAAGDDSATALAKAITTTVVLTEVIKALPTFLDGIENTGSHGMGLDGKGGFLSVLHPEERVFTKGQNAKIGDISNDDAAAILESHRLGSYNNKIQGLTMLMNTTGESTDTSGIEDKLQSLIDKPENSIEVAEIMHGSMLIRDRRKKGNRTTTNIFKIKS